MPTFQHLIRDLTQFWEKQGCCIHQGHDLETGAGTFNPATFLRCLGPEPYSAAYVEPSRRPTDGRYGDNPNRVQHYFQYQVILKPSPPDIQTVYLDSLQAVGLDLSKHDIRFVHDDWESPTLGAWGLGWETWIDGMEVTQITYFQSVGGVSLKPVTGEITYGLERLAMYIQGVDSIFDIQWNDSYTYGDLYHRNEVEWSGYNFEQADTSLWLRQFEDFEKEANKLVEQNLPLPAYDFVAKASHAFNMLDARGVISVTERTGYIARIRELACKIAEAAIQSREELGYPLLNKGTFKPSIVPKPSSAPHLQEEKANYLLEIGSEELPATFVPIGMEDLERKVHTLLDDHGLSYKAIQTYGTPRRLSLLIEELQTKKPEEKKERKGPPVKSTFDSSGHPTKAALGFFKSLGIDAPPLSDIRSRKTPAVEIREHKGEEYLYATLTTPETHTSEILAKHLPLIIPKLDFPKTMRWADLDVTYARPILWIVSLFGNEVVPFAVGNILASNESSGHRQLDPSTFVVPSPSDYVKLLKKHSVLVDVNERKQKIIDELDAIESSTNCKVAKRDKVLNEVVHLVEWPEVTAETFDSSFLKVPSELLISEMVEHQKYFPVTDSNGKLQNRFLITANNTPSDEIRHGNLKVLAARLSDGLFLYEQDLSHDLSFFVHKLKQITFQKKLGSVFEKQERIKQHANALHALLPISDKAHLDRAAELCKADLATAAVGEFPELQGIMGSYYAKEKGEAPEVADAIREHWMPLGDQAPLPKTPTGTLLSLADKLDNLIGCFGVGLKPSSSSDPYALRRQALGIIKIIVAGEHRLPLRQILTDCAEHFPHFTANQKQEAIDGVLDFFQNRIKTVFQSYGFKRDEIEAGLSGGVEDLYDAFLRIQALHQFRNSPEFSQLTEVYKRAKGQLNAHDQVLVLNPTLLAEPAELKLHQTLESISSPLEEAILKQHYESAYQQMAKLQAPLSTLFDEVKILADDPKIKENRIALLQQVFTLFNRLLDIGKIQK